MRIDRIYKIYPNITDLEKLTYCNSYLEISKSFGIPKSTIVTWKKDGIQLEKLYSYFGIKRVNKWILSSGEISQCELELSSQYKE